MLLSWSLPGCSVRGCGGCALLCSLLFPFLSFSCACAQPQKPEGYSDWCDAWHFSFRCFGIRNLRLKGLARTFLPHGYGITRARGPKHLARGDEPRTYDTAVGPCTEVHVAAELQHAEHAISQHAVQFGYVRPACAGAEHDGIIFFTSSGEPNSEFDTFAVPFCA